MKADVSINGRDEGVVRGPGRSLVTFRGNEGSDISFVSVQDRQYSRETFVSALFVLIGSLSNALAVPIRRRLQQRWEIAGAGHFLGWLEYRRSMPEQYQLRLSEDAEERALEILAVAILLARPASSGTVESYEELHQIGNLDIEVKRCVSRRIEYRKYCQLRARDLGLDHAEPFG